MTGGTVVVLGKTGRNFAAGMTGGLAYILDEDFTFQANCNLDDGRYLQRLSPRAEETLHSLIGEHLARTGSQKAAHILANWEHCLSQFWQLVPISEVNNDEVNQLQEEKVSA
jgi:glutamate synthase domain-containing protein 3